MASLKPLATFSGRLDFFIFAISHVPSIVLSFRSVVSKPSASTCSAIVSRGTPLTPFSKESAYPPTIENVPTISETFYENSREIANQRVTEAGYRLAELLRELLLTRSSGKGN